MNKTNYFFSRCLLVIIGIGQAFAGSAQINFRFVPGEEEGRSTMTGYTADKQFQEVDSVRFKINDYMKGIFTQDSFAYKGGFKNNIINGYGEMICERDNFSFRYAGMWQDGMMHGPGRLTRYKDHLVVENYPVRGSTKGLLRNWGKGAEKNRVYEFKGNFVNGIPTDGLFMCAFMNDGTPTVFYAGEVLLTGKYVVNKGKKDFAEYGFDIMLHGFGTMYRTRTESDGLGAAGGIYMGQFWRNQITGFGMSNILDKSDKAGMLQLGLHLGDRLVKTFKTIDVGTEWLTEDAVPSDRSGTTFTLLPDMQKSAKVTFDIDSATSYTGAVYRGRPYGPGMVKYKDGFIDLGFWNDGEKLPVRIILESLLPNPNVLTPTVVTESSRNFVAGKARKGAYVGVWSKQSYWWEREKKKVIYYAAFTGQNAPEGWGWKVPADDPDGVAEAGNFIGRLAGKKTANNADTMFVQAGHEWKVAAYHATRRLDGYVGTAASTDFYDELRNTRAQIVFDQNDEVITGKDKANPGEEFSQRVAISDDRFRRASFVAYVKGERDAVVAAGAAYKALPVILPKKLVINKNMPGESYITDGQKTVRFQPMQSNSLKQFDFVITNNNMKMVVRNAYGNLFLDDGSALPSGTVYVLRGYQVAKSFTKWTCPYCNGKGGSTQTVGTRGKVGYETEVINRSGNTISVQQNPVYIKLPGFEVKTKCGACNGVPTKDVNNLIVEVK